MKCNADNKSQCFKMWLKPFIKVFASWSGSSLQTNKNFQNIQVKIYFIIDIRVLK